ncbi:hypothetical protein VTN02DRAFT_855 [Thermoascus thermophilus]
MQTEDKAIEMFAQPFDHSFNDLFNQYVNMDSNGDGNKETSFSDDIDQLFPPGSFLSDCGDLSPIGSSSRHPQSPQPWRKGLWSLQQDAASCAEQRSAFLETIHPSAISDLSLSLEASSRPGEALALYSSTSPSTPPATPSRRASASYSAILTPKSNRRREPNDRRALLRKQSFSPSLMRSTHLQKGKMTYPDAWAQRFQNFNNVRGSDQHIPLSPPPSDILVQHETMHNNPTQMNVSTSGPSADGILRESVEMPTQYDSNLFHHQSPAVSMSSPSANTLARQRYLGHPNSAALTTASSPPADDFFHSPHSSESQAMPSWYNSALGTPALPFTPEIHSHDAQSWWSPMPSRVSQSQGQPQYQSMVSPVPQRPIQNINQNDLLQGGLMIHFDPSFDMASAAGSSFSSSGLPATTNHEGRPYPNMPAAQQRFSNDHPFATPHSAHVSHPSRSPSASPTSTSPKSGMAARNAANLRVNQRRSHSRKLSSQSSNGPKPVKAPSGSSGSPKGANKTVSVSFVNFTPQDSHKILTGVAPSGSSKTKARREQEAREKRRKLSEAALMAVRKAGGDVEALEAVLC